MEYHTMLTVQEREQIDALKTRLRELTRETRYWRRLGFRPLYLEQYGIMLTKAEQLTEPKESIRLYNIENITIPRIESQIRMIYNMAKQRLLERYRSLGW